MRVTREYLRKNPNHIFVFGDNLLRRGKGGAAVLRDEPNTYGFVTKKAPNNKDESFYKPEEYMDEFLWELNMLERCIRSCPKNIWLITPLGSGLANRYRIWEEIIQPGLEVLRKYKNVIFLWEGSNP
jgi:hypothetical protein